MQVLDYIEDSYCSVRRFNNIAQNLENVDHESVHKQLQFIKEELDETFDAYHFENEVELLDGAVDLWVTVAGLLQKLEASGFNVAEAMHRVDVNNLSKFPSYDLSKGVEGIAVHQPPESQPYLMTAYDVIVFKNANGKIMKPTTFKPVDLSDMAIGFFKE